MNRPKPTDSEQLEQIYADLENSFISFLRSDPQSTTSVPATMAAQQFQYRISALLKQRDQQRLSAALKTLPTLADLPNYEENQAAKWAGFQDGVIACEQALTAALGPDNSKIEE